jgi:hypothetical protein
MRQIEEQGGVIQQYLPEAGAIQATIPYSYAGNIICTLSTIQCAQTFLMVAQSLDAHTGIVEHSSNKIMGVAFTAAYEQLP